MRTRLFVCLSFLPLVAGCGGAGGGGTSSTGTTTTTAAPVGYTGPYVYVTRNTLTGFTTPSTGAILKVQADSSGTATAVASFTTTQNGGFNGLAADSSGTLYTVRYSPTYAVATYPASSTGESTPARTFAAPFAVRHLAFGPGGDLLGVSESASGAAVRFAAGASGAFTPVQLLPPITSGAKFTTLDSALGIAQDAAGNLYVADVRGIKVFAASATGDAAPIRTIIGPRTTFVSNINVNPNSSTIPLGIVLSPSGEIYVSTQTCTLTSPTVCSGAVLVFAANADGDVAPLRSLAGDLTSISRPGEMAFDKAGNLYVMDVSTSAQSSLSTPRVLRFSGSATGNTAPLNSFTVGTADALSSGGSFTVF